MSTETRDVVIIGAGHNGLVAAILLARKGLSVTVLEDKAMVGGAAKTERPFAKAPNLSTSTGAYLLGVMPPELITKLGVDIPTIRRDPHYFLPTTDRRFLLFGSDQAEMKRQFIDFFSEADWRANEALQEEIAALREDVAPSWMKEPLSIEATAEQYVRPALRKAFIDLCRGTVGNYLARFQFKSDLVAAMYAVTDGFSGLTGTWDTPGTGMNFLVHNMCRLPGSGGTFMIVKGGMGTVTQTLATKAHEHGAEILTGKKVAKIVSAGGVAKGVLLEDGTEIAAKVVLTNADPFRMRDLLGKDQLTPEYNQRLDGGQYSSTIHLLPDEKDVLRSLKDGFDAARAGKLAEFPTMEWYIHTTVDPTMQDGHGHHNSALFVQWVPYEIAGSSWEKEEAKYVQHLLSICDRFAPGTSDLVVDTFPLHPQKIEQHFGITRGHIHHVDNTFGFDDRLPHTTPIQGAYSCSAGCHPAGSVLGASGHNAAERVLRDLGRE